MTAIVTDAHYRMAMSVIRDLVDNGVCVIACEYDGISEPVGFYSKYVSECVTVSRENAVAELTALCKRVWEKDGEQPVIMAVGAGTALLVSEHAKEFSCVCGFLLPSPEQLELFNDKRRVSRLAKRLGIPVAREYGISDTFDFPVAVKPICGEKAGLHAAERYAIVNNRQELEAAYDGFMKITGEPPIIQEYLSGSGAGCSVLALDGQVTAYICHRRIREYPVSGGPSSCCESAELAQLTEYVERAVAFERFSGVAMFEFKADANGEYRLLEVNPRVWGTYPLTRVAKTNFTYMWFLAAAGHALPSFKAAEHVRMVYYPSDAAAMLGYLKRGKIKGFFGGVADIFNPRVKNGLNEKGDRRPYFVYLRALLKRGGK